MQSHLRLRLEKVSHQQVWILGEFSHPCDNPVKEFSESLLHVWCFLLVSPHPCTSLACKCKRGMLKKSRGTGNWILAAYFTPQNCLRWTVEAWVRIISQGRNERRTLHLLDQLISLTEVIFPRLSVPGDRQSSVPPLTETFNSANLHLLPATWLRHRRV